jgi:hypothetical protein
MSIYTKCLFTLTSTVPAIHAYRSLVQQGAAAVLRPIPTALFTMVAAAAMAKVAEHLGTRLFDLNSPARQPYKAYIIPGLWALSSFLTVKSQFPIRFLTAIAPVITQGRCVALAVFALFVFCIRSNRRTPTPILSTSSSRGISEGPVSHSKNPPVTLNHAAVLSRIWGAIASVTTQQYERAVEAYRLQNYDDATRDTKAAAEVYQDMIVAGKKPLHTLKTEAIKNKREEITGYGWITNEDAGMLIQRCGTINAAPTTIDEIIDSLSPAVGDEVANLYKGGKIIGGSVFIPGSISVFIPPILPNANTKSIITSMLNGLMSYPWLNVFTSTEQFARAQQILLMVSETSRGSVKELVREEMRLAIGPELAFELAEPKALRKIVVMTADDNKSLRVTRSYVQELLDPISKSILNKIEFSTHQILEFSTGHIRMDVTILK